jgi:hypothetical protein
MDETIKTLVAYKINSISDLGIEFATKSDGNWMIAAPDIEGQMLRIWNGKANFTQYFIDQSEKQCAIYIPSLLMAEVKEKWQRFRGANSSF